MLILLGAEIFVLSKINILMRLPKKYILDVLDEVLCVITGLKHKYMIFTNTAMIKIWL